MVPVRDQYGDNVVLEDDALRLVALHQETLIALQIVLRTGAFEAGTYVRSDSWLTDWKRINP